MRRYQEPPRKGVRYKHRPSAYAILIRDRHMLITHQDAPVPEFQLPGGGIDPGEGASRALHREVIEETGWTIGAVRWITTYRRFVYMPEYDIEVEKICQIFLARPAIRLGPPSEEGHVAIWLPIAEAVDTLSNAADRDVARRFLTL